ncbi:hypothetical protein BCR33DRAFT_754162 [Rhizoclosmatium globosum]|uniref:Helicase ATP-binding domain-containing protein n=1 Tax=Rhizoclosmatium globosum TaxID=329046 RepID=A0A1Y2C2Q7_9FUNG|nr:hypothetical protein BCR33DRAFT_754162 [Rhizoclosmatium globosum]|eukprot:ORY41281.1 hypothetical protein BCR33DRAFT_754162 [Rhizoclosmatium globosum]
MGLGKTMQTIATMILNRSEDRERRTTLIVAPTSLILQWQEEIKSRVRAGVFKVFFLPERKNMTSNRLKQYDIVITTYGTRGELFKVKWHRVVLDEAHIVKNKNTRSARACVQLNSSLRWCLTGTPIQNKIGELYSLIDFLDIKPYCKWEKFRDEIEKPFKAGKHKRVMKRVQALLKAICLRRTKASQLDGKPIITLKPKTSSLIEVDFTGPEREFYDSMQKKVLLKFNAYLKAGTVMQNYSNVLVLLLRLRQACCHPKLVSEKTLEAAAPGAHPQAVVDPLEALTPEIQTRLLGMKLKSGYECPICFDAIRWERLLLDVDMCFVEMYYRKVCPECRGPIGVHTLVSVDAFLKSAKKAGMKESVIEVNGNGKRVKEEAEEDLSAKAKGKRRKLISDEESDDDDDDEDQPELDVEDGWISSTKIDQMMKVILKIRRESPHDKIIVFTQFRGMMDLCETPLRGSKIGFVRYDGSMTADQRLNLTCANHVIILDFWWNVAVENQAVDRVHRFGQEKEVSVHRISIKNTVEQRILQLQAEKQDMFNNALGEGGVKGLSKNRLGLNDLIQLFRGSGGGADLSDEE